MIKDEPIAEYYKRYEEVKGVLSFLFSGANFEYDFWPFCP